MTERVFNRMPRHLFRKQIPLAEVSGGIVVLAVLAAALAWIAQQQGNFDPAERDLPYAMLEAQPVEDRLYKRPLQPWVEPGTAGSAAATGPRLGVFPPALLEGDWQIASRLRTFAPDNLFEKINGAAEQYLRFGFRQLHFIGIAAPDGGATLDLELYDQGDFAGGLGIFSAQRDPARSLQQIGDLHYYETGAGAIGVMGPWFFKVVGNAQSEAVQGKARQVVRALATLPVEAAQVPAAYRLLREGLKLPFGAIAHQPLNVFQYDFARDFWFGRVAPGGDARYFLHRAADAVAAGELYEQILAEHRYDYETLAEDEARTTLRHRFLASVFGMGLAGPVLYGVENAPDAAAADAAMATLLQAVAPAEAGER